MLFPLISIACLSHLQENCYRIRLRPQENHRCLLSNSSATVINDGLSQDTRWSMTSNAQAQKYGRVRTVGSYDESEVKQISNTNCFLKNSMILILWYLRTRKLTVCYNIIRVSYWSLRCYLLRGMWKYIR